jgi:hypothetical protein
MLNRPNEALQYLNPSTLAESLAVLPLSPYSITTSDPLNNGKYILFVNFAIVNIMKVRAFEEIAFLIFFRMI